MKKEKQIVQCKLCDSKNVHINKTINILHNRTSIQYRCLNCGKYFSISADKKIKTKRIVVISDLHCGHISGLTPTKYNYGKKNKYYTYREELWGWFEKNIKSLFPIDILIVNGDAIDGRQEKNGGNDLLVNDRLEQSQMAIDVIKTVNAKKVFISRGTPYHTGKKEDFENSIAYNTNAEIRNHLFLDVNGCKIDAKHKIGRSNIPHGRFTQLARVSLWNSLMNETSEKANIIIRSHIHYHISLSHSNNILCLTTPCLQGSSAYGEKECEGNTDVGFLKIDINEFGNIDNWRLYKAKLKTEVNPTIFI